MKIICRRIGLIGFIAFALAGQAPAQELITNGGFEAGFTGWTRVDQLGSDGTWSLQSGTVSPVNGFAVPAPTGGLNAAMTDSQGPGTHVLYQDFAVPPSVSSATLTFDLYINNHAVDFFSPASLDFSTAALNQQFRVDILTTSSDPFSLAPTDVLLNVFQTQPGNALVSGYTTIASDLTSLLSAHAGETLRLRFAEADNVSFLNVGIDNVSIAVPEPSTLTIFLGGATVLGLSFVRRKRQ